jgi:hypothetical protein
MTPLSKLATTWDLFIIVLFKEHEEWVFHELIIDDHSTLNFCCGQKQKNQD